MTPAQDYDYDEGAYKRYDLEQACVECGEDSSDLCVCGNPLCYMHFEVQGGFCNQTPDSEHSRMMEEFFESQAE